MSLPIEKLNKLMEEIKQLDEKDAEKAVTMLEDYIRSKKKKNYSKPSDYRGALKHMNIDVEEECRKMRKEWVREWE